MALTPTDVDELYENVKRLLELWMKIKLVFIKAFSEEETTREHETGFLNLKSEVTRIARTLSERIPPGLKFDSDKMLEMLKNAMSMEHIGKLPQGERQNLYKIWHHIYVRLTRTLGALETFKQGYYPHLHRQRLQSRVIMTSGKK